MLPEFMFLPPTDVTPEFPAGLILHTQEPFYLGKVYRFKNDYDAMLFTKTNPPFILSDVPGYNIYIGFYDSLTGKVRITGKEWEDELNVIFKNMAEWYRDNKIKPKISFYKKFAL